MKRQQKGLAGKIMKKRENKVQYDFEERKKPLNEVCQNLNSLCEDESSLFSPYKQNKYA